jgi:uncharacterized protein YjbI with pentapeptide repeats
MANEEHLAILQQGVNEWNKWRKENPEIEPDLSNATLYEQNLNYVNLSNSNLSGIILTGSELKGADFSNSSLYKAFLNDTFLMRTVFFETHAKYANFLGSNLSRSIFIESEFYKTDLSNTNLSDSYLFKSNLSFSNLFSANFSGSIIRNVNINNASFKKCRLDSTIFVGIDFRSAIDLETIEYSSFSSISVDTIIYSHGKIPIELLQASGITGKFIQELPQLLGISQEVQYVEKEVSKVEIQYIEVIKEVPQYIEVIKEVPKIEVQYVEVEVPKIEYKYIEVPVQIAEPTLEPEEINHLKNLINIKRRRVRKLKEQLAELGRKSHDPHITIEIEDTCAEIAQYKETLRSNGVTIADQPSDFVK